MKVKAKGAPPAKKDKSKKTHGGIQKGGNNLKKGKFTIAPKKQVKLRKYFKGRSVHIISFSSTTRQYSSSGEMSGKKSTPKTRLDF